MYDASPDPSILLKFRWSRRVRKPIVQDLKTGSEPLVGRFRAISASLFRPAQRGIGPLERFLG